MSDSMFYIKCPECAGDGCASCGNGFVEATQEDIDSSHSNCNSCHYCSEYDVCLNDQSPFEIVHSAIDYCCFHIPKVVE